MKQYQCIRSSLLSGRELVEVIARLEKRYAKGEFNNYRKNSSTCYFLGRTLPSLDPFAEVLLVDIASLAATPLAPEIVMALAQEWGERSQRKTRLAWHLDDVSFDRQSDGKVTISAGLDRHGFYCGVAGIQEQSPGYRDREMRARFFETIVAAMGLSEQVRVRWDGTDLTMEASPPWTLYFPFAQLGGK